LDNNKKQQSGLKPIKPIIDDYDLMSCGLSNNLQDASEYLVVVRGYDGANLEEVIQNTRTKKTIGVDADGDVDFKTVDVPYEARKVKLDLDRENIYKFGMGFDNSQVGDGNITNVVIKSRYALLDMKVNKLQIRLKQFLKKILKIVLKEINEANGTDYQMKDVYIRFTPEIITNEADNAAIEKTNAERKQVEITTMLDLATKLDNETVMQEICDILDIDYDEIKGKLPQEEDLAATNQAMQTLENVVVEDE
jgi:SPP1 family phage portal protein